MERKIIHGTIHRDKPPFNAEYDVAYNTDSSGVQTVNGIPGPNVVLDSRDIPFEKGPHGEIQGTSVKQEIDSLKQNQTELYRDVQQEIRRATDKEEELQEELSQEEEARQVVDQDLQEQINKLKKSGVQDVLVDGKSVVDQSDYVAKINGVEFKENKVDSLLLPSVDTYPTTKIVKQNVDRIDQRITDRNYHEDFPERDSYTDEPNIIASIDIGTHVTTTKRSLNRYDFKEDDAFTEQQIEGLPEDIARLDKRIDDLDYYDTFPEGTENNIIASVKQENGQISVTKRTINRNDFLADDAFTEQQIEGLPEDLARMTSETRWERGSGENSVQTKDTGAQALGVNSVAQGLNTVAGGDYSHAEGYASKTAVDPDDPTCGKAAHAEGTGTIAKGNSSHAEGGGSLAKGSDSHAEGNSSSAMGDASHSEGNWTITNNLAEHAEGTFNLSNMSSSMFGDAGNTLHSVGIGRATGELEDDRKNAFEIMQNGDTYIIGLGEYNGKNISSANTVQDVVNTEIADRIQDIADVNVRIDNLDYSETFPQGTQNNIIASISQENGQLSVTKRTINRNDFLSDNAFSETQIENLPEDINTLNTKSVSADGLMLTMKTIDSEGQQGEDLTFQPILPVEKEYLEDQVFNQYFTVTITGGSTSSTVFNVQFPHTFTLTVKYGNDNVDLYQAPSGWTRTGVGTYTISKNFDITSGSTISVTSGAPVCYYKNQENRKKTAASQTYSATKPGYIFTSDLASVTSAQITNLINQSNTVKIANDGSPAGDKSISGTKNKYVYYLVPQYRQITVKQLGVSIVEAKVTVNDIIVHNSDSGNVDKNIGDYYYYRTSQLIGTDSLTATIANG